MLCHQFNTSPRESFSQFTLIKAATLPRKVLGISPQLPTVTSHFVPGKHPASGPFLYTAVMDRGAR